MESWSSLIWVKRILPFIVIFAVWAGYSKITEQTKQKNENRIKKYALIAAQIWHSGATLRGTPDKYPSVRDSIFSVNGIDSLSFRLYLQENEENPENYREYVRWLSFYADSLFKEYETEAKTRDSLAIADSLGIEDSLSTER